MSSLNKRLKEINYRINDMKRFHPKRKWRRFVNGMKVFVLMKFESLNSNGRSLSDNFNTGQSQMHRLISDGELGSRNERLAIEQFVKNFSGRVYLNLDHSSSGYLTFAAVAAQTGAGRGMPFFFQVNRNSHKPARKQTTPKKGRFNPKKGVLLKSLKKMIQTMHSLDPSLSKVIVADRWFGDKNTIDFLSRQGCSYLLRTAINKKVVLQDGQSLHLRDITDGDYKITYNGLEIRLIVNGSQTKDACLLLTNLLDLPREELLKRYKTRWEIESIFQDMKWLQFLKYHRIGCPKRFLNLLRFISLGWNLAFQTLGGSFDRIKILMKTKFKNEKKRLS